MAKATKQRSVPKSGDTLHMWERYQDDALVWRSLALLQIPTTLIAIIFAIILWNTRSYVVHVPPKPAPGIYAMNEIPESEFITEATEFVNLIASYQPTNAQRQFNEALTHVIEPFLSTFQNELLPDELGTIEATSRSQFFFIDPTKTTVRPVDDHVEVSLIGERVKVVAGRELPGVRSKYTVSLQAIPRHRLNPYGIVVVGVRMDDEK